MSLKDQYQLAGDPKFLQRLAPALTSASVSIFNEVVNEVQTLTFGGTVTGGTYTLNYAGQVTSAIPFNASAATVQAALQALSTVGTTALSNVIVTGGPGPTALVVTFVNQLAASTHPLLVVVSSLTGTTPTLTPTRSTAGVGTANHAARAARSSVILANPVGYTAVMAYGIATDPTIQADYGAGGVNGADAITDAHIIAAVSAMFNAYT